MPQKISRLGRSLSDATIRLHESIARAAGLSGTEHKVVYMVAEQSAMTAGRIAKATRLTTGAVTGLIDRLEKHGFVKRVFDKTDRRKVMVEACKERIENVLAPYSKKIEASIKSLISKYTAEEQMLIERYLLETVDTLNNLATEVEEGNYD